MNQRIVYPNSDGGVSIVIPTGVLSTEDTAKKDVPSGVPYKIINVSEIPSDRTFRDAWEYNFTNPDGYGE